MRWLGYEDGLELGYRPGCSSDRIAHCLLESLVSLWPNKDLTYVDLCAGRGSYPNEDGTTYEGSAPRVLKTAERFQLRCIAFLHEKSATSRSKLKKNVKQYLPKYKAASKKKSEPEAVLILDNWEKHMAKHHSSCGPNWLFFAAPYAASCFDGSASSTKLSVADLALPAIMSLTRQKGASWVAYIPPGGARYAEMSKRALTRMNGFIAGDDKQGHFIITTYPDQAKILTTIAASLRVHNIYELNNGYPRY